MASMEGFSRHGIQAEENGLLLLSFMESKHYPSVARGRPKSTSLRVATEMKIGERIVGEQTDRKPDSLREAVLPSGYPFCRREAVSSRRL